MKLSPAAAFALASLSTALPGATAALAKTTGPQGREATGGEIWHRSVQVSTRLEANGLYETTQTWEVKADTPSAARAAAQQTFGYSSGLEEVTVLSAYTRKADGTRIDVQPGAILHQAVGVSEEFPSFNDWQSRAIVFPDVEAGDTVHYVLRRRARQVLFPGQYETSLMPGPLGNVVRADVSVTMPRGEALNVSTSHMAEEKPAVHGRWVTRRWRLDQDGNGGSVWFDASTFPDYAALGNAYAARAMPKAVPTQAVRALAERLAGDAADPWDKAHRIYDYVAKNIRYVALQMGRGRVVPHSAEQVLHVGYGDCKDHVTLLQALLAAVDIHSEPALISVKPRYDLPATPTLAVLDHVVLYVPSFDLYLDSTSPFAQFGMLPFGDYGKPVVLAGADGSRVARVPMLSPDAAVTHVRTEAQIEPDGTVSGNTVTTASGPSAIALREVASDIESEGTSPAAEARLRRLGTPGEGGFSFATPLALGNSYKLRGHFQLEDKLGDEADNRFAIPAGLPVLSRSGAFLVSPTTVSGGGHVCYAGRQIEDITLRLPEGAGAGSLPHGVDISAGDASYQARYTLHGGAVLVHREFAVNVPHPLCSQKEYEAMRPVLTAVRGDERAEVALVAPGAGDGPQSKGVIGASNQTRSPNIHPAAVGTALGMKD